MPTKSRQDLYDRFATGKKPTQDDFADLIDAMINIADDGIGISEMGEPMEITERGEQKRLLDFSSSPDSPIWRINARSADGNKSGLNISSNEQSRLFIEKDSGYTGINNDAPAAKLHITPTVGGPALQVDKANKNPAFIIGENGKMSIGENPQESGILTVKGGVDLNGRVNINGECNAIQGMVVTGAALQAKQGLMVENGAFIETGLAVKEGLSVSGPLTANAGAVINELPLEVNKGLLINEGATVQTGVLTANAGLTVNGAELNANAGAIVSGALLTVKNGLTVAGATNINGQLQANGGLTVNNSTLAANGQVMLGNAESGTVSANGQFIAKKGIILEDSLFRAEQGIVISEGDLSVENNLDVDGELRVNAGLTVNDSALQATGQVTLGNSDNGEVVIAGELQANKGIVVTAETLRAQAGAVVTGGGLQAENGLTVKNGATIETGLLTVKEGVAITNDATFNANGIVNLGNMNNGVVTVNGWLRAINGGTISGAKLELQNGLLVNGTLEALDVANLEIANIKALNVSDINITGDFGLTAVNLESLSATEATIGTLSTDGDANVYGKCTVINNVVLAGGRIIATYEGVAAVAPKIMIRKGIITGATGHFDLTVNADKQVTIIYDDSSDLANFINDWKMYQNTHLNETDGIDFRRVGAGSGKLKEEEVELIPSATAFKEYRIPDNGVRIIYTGTQPGTPQFKITSNIEDPDSNEFHFAIQDLALGIFYPYNILDRTVGNLLTSWNNWKSMNPDLTADFEIRQTGDADWQLDDILEVQHLIPTGEVVRESKLDELIISNTSNIQNQPRLIVAAAAPGFEAEVGIEVTLDTLIITLGTVDNSPQAVYNAWFDWVKNGNETYGFAIAETVAPSPIKVFQRENLVAIDETHSQIETAGIVVTYSGVEADLAKVLLQEGIGDSFSFSIDDLNNELTIHYPPSVTERTITALLAAWSGVSDKHGFDLSGSGAELFIRQEEVMGTVVAVIKEYQPTTGGVDNITIRYSGLETDTPGIIIRPNDTNDFGISIDESKMMTIQYPADKLCTVAGLMAYWDGLTPVEWAGFSLMKHEIENAFVAETSGNLAVNAGNKIFSQGIIRTNIVTIDGHLKFGASQIEISTISNSEALAENSDAILSTQKAVKSYVDRALAVKADQSFVTEELAKKADQSFVTEELAKKADQSFVMEELAKKADQSFVMEELTKKADQSFMTEELAKKADQSFMTEELAKKADQSFVTEELAKKADQSFVTEELAKKAGQSFVTEELTKKADASIMATALASKANSLKPEDLSIDSGTTVTVDEISLTTDCRGLLVVMITAADNASTGLFAIHGTDSIIKIAGDGMSDRQDNPDTWNVYAEAGVVMLQSASPDDVTAKVTYFGA